MKNEIEFWARFFRYPFLLTAIIVFIAGNVNVFKDDEVGMWLFICSGILWLLATAYIEVREQERISKELPSKTVKGLSVCNKKGGNKVIKWLRKYATIVGIIVVLGAAIALYLTPSGPGKPAWVVIFVIIGPLAMFIASRVERRLLINENLIRQLQSLVGDARALEFSIRSFARDLLNNSSVQNELESTSIQGWRYYIESLGAWQLSTLSILERDLRLVDPFEESNIVELVTAFYQILGRVLEVESYLSTSLCPKIKNIPPDAQNSWEYIQQAHSRLGTQLNGLKPILNNKGCGDLFDTFVNQPPQNLIITA